jgi:hypothetical protein
MSFGGKFVSFLDQSYSIFGEIGAGQFRKLVTFHPIHDTGTTEVTQISEYGKLGD